MDCSNPDDPALITFESSFTSEFQQQDMVWARLDGKPTDAVTVMVRSSDESEAIVETRLLKFQPKDACDWHRVLITGVNDGVSDGDQDYRVEFYEPGNGPQIGAIEGVNFDNDQISGVNIQIQGPRLGTINEPIEIGTSLVARKPVARKGGTNCPSG